MTFNAPDAMPSGKPFPVAEVSGRPATALGDFLGQQELLLDLGGDRRRVVGVGAEWQDGVRFHEKDVAGSGKDVRVWQVREAAGGGFEALLASLY